MKQAIFLICILGLCLPTFQKGLDCALCISFVSGIDKEEIKGDKDLKKTLDRECRETFEMKVADQFCEQLVNDEYKRILEKIENDEKPDKICKDYNMC